MITENKLNELYIVQKLSMMEVSKLLECSPHKVVYWMDKYKIKRRSISDAIYSHKNPNGDPFRLKKIKSIQDAELLGMGIGLYWGEGTKRSKHSVRLGNTDPGIIKTFRRFLIELCGVQPDRFRYSLQVLTTETPRKP